MRKKRGVFCNEEEMKEIREAAKSLGIENDSSAIRSLSLIKAREINNKKQVNDDESKT